MKNPTLIILTLFCSTLFVNAQTIQPAPADKAVVYFVRPSSAGFAINFSYFDSTRLIGKFNAPKYIRYVCEPGKHLFWARSENRDFVEAEVEAGKIYFIEAKATMGAVKAGVNLRPVDPRSEKSMKKINKLLNKKPSQSFTAVELKNEEDRMKEVIARGLEKYKEDKRKGKVHAQLPATMSY